MSFFNRKILGAAGLIAAGTLGLSIAQADVTGSAYLNNSAASDAVIGFTHGAPDATFTVPSPTNPACAGPLFSGDTLCFNSGDNNGGNFGGAYTLGGFLSSGGATVLTGSAGALNSSLDNTVFEFTGTVTVTNGETFTAGHDDGLQLLIGSDLVIDAPLGTAYEVTTETYTGPSGTLPFDLVYGEAFGAPAALGISLPLESPPTSVPEPSSIALLMLGLPLAAFALLRRRVRA